MGAGPSRVRRPTENAALRNVAKSPAPRHGTEELFAALVHAYAVTDRHGLQLFGLAVVRAGGGPLRESLS